LPRAPLLPVLRRVLASLEPDLRLRPDLFHLPASPEANATTHRGVPNLPSIRLPLARPPVQPECRSLPWPARVPGRHSVVRRLRSAGAPERSPGARPVAVPALGAGGLEPGLAHHRLRPAPRRADVDPRMRHHSTTGVTGPVCMTTRHPDERAWRQCERVRSRKAKGDATEWH